MKKKNITIGTIQKMSYVDLMALLDETNRPPGGRDSVRRLILNTFLNKESQVLDVGCNTGYCSFEIAHSVKSKVTGIDLSPKMIRVANERLKKDEEEFQRLISFQVADAMDLPFSDGKFDVVMSGGSTAFIENKQKAILEYKRVCKEWGFVADINFYFYTKPPKQLLADINQALDIEILPWGINFWIDLYKDSGLEEYCVYKRKLKKVSTRKVRDYCRYMISRKDWPTEVQSAAYKKLYSYMKLFNKEHQYLSFGVFIFRKAPYREQKILFE